ncbi:hypothetical protein JTB14_001730 [Gonioctena quinquepunctata]|nr:hypothetical protein JTB14_001730 [Gonioctena quinquepunctata]
MGTPLKKLTTVLSPKVLSPLSPRLLFLPKLNENVNSVVSSNVQRIPTAKRLDYSKLVQKSNNLSVKPVNIYVTDCSEEKAEVEKNDIFINTPKKEDIIENGVENDKFLNILGKGGFGKVFRAIYKDSTVAMKLVKTSKFSSREKNALPLLHKNIVKTIHVIGSEKNAFSIIIMEYFPVCQDLQSILDNTEIELNNNLVVKYARDICEGLLFCHENGILHLDLKPQNVLLCEKVCKICDFGNSMNILELGDHFEHQGTVVYSAPEILKGC